MARKPAFCASSAAYASIVPTSCRGRSASTASRRRVPALTDRCDMTGPRNGADILYAARAGGPAAPYPTCGGGGGGGQTKRTPPPPGDRPSRGAGHKRGGPTKAEEGGT